VLDLDITKNVNTLKKQKNKSLHKTIEFTDHGINHKIFGYVVPGSQAEYLMLKRKFYRKDESWFYTNHKKGQQLLFNLKFLESIKEIHGELHCEFCGKQKLKIYKWYQRHKDSKIMATADHFFPKSYDKDNLSFDITNMVVACDDCNNKKGKDFWPLESVRFPYINTYEKLKQIYNGSTKIQRGYAEGPRNFTN
jgi:5-methylcytosine-specific restriction endonuclease McrA